MSRAVIYETYAVTTIPTPTMKRIQYHRYGGPELMRLEEVEVPAPGKGQVLVRVLAASVNAVDWHIRNGGLRLFSGRRFPRGMGGDFAGVVEQVGAGVTRFRAGDPVFGGLLPRPAGAFAERVVADEKYVARKPPDLSYQRAACLPTAGVTAWQAVISKGRLRAGQSVFITGCLGGVGRIAAEVALMHGASVSGSCRGAARDDALGLGVEPVLGFGFDPVPLEGRFDLVLDAASTLSVRVARSLLKPGGRFVDIHPSPAKYAKSAFSRHYSVLFGVYKVKDFEELARAAADSRITLPIARTVPLTGAIDALTELEEKHTPKGGKVVILPQ
jgi:NADPH:quinone reductase-like Zn-dependent oxidoreductase